MASSSSAAAPMETESGAAGEPDEASASNPYTKPLRQLCDAKLLRAEPRQCASEKDLKNAVNAKLPDDFEHRLTNINGGRRPTDAAKLAQFDRRARWWAEALRGVCGVDATQTSAHDHECGVHGQGHLPGWAFGEQAGAASAGRKKRRAEAGPVEEQPREAAAEEELVAAQPQVENDRLHALQIRDNAECFLTAADHGLINELKELLDARVDVNFRDSYGYDALMYAARQGHADTITLLLGAGADPKYQRRLDALVLDMKTRDPRAMPSAFIAAVVYGHTGAVRVLLQKGVDVNDMKDCRQRLALSVAVAEGHGQLVDVLLAAGAHPNQEDDNGDTALALAVRDGRRDIVQSLLGAKACPNVYPPALVVAVKFERAEIAKLLLDTAADPTNVLPSQQDREETILMHCANADIVEMLLATERIDVDAKNVDGETALMRASARGSTGATAKLLEAHADVDAQDASGRTALMKASDAKVTLKLLAADADTNITDDHGATALIHHAMSNGGDAATSISHFLSRMTPDAPVSGAFQGGHANPDLQDDEGMTALMHAAARGHAASVEALLDAEDLAGVSVDLFLKDALGRDAFALSQGPAVRRMIGNAIHKTNREQSAAEDRRTIEQLAAELEKTRLGQPAPAASAPSAGPSTPVPAANPSAAVSPSASLAVVVSDPVPEKDRPFRYEGMPGKVVGPAGGLQQRGRERRSVQWYEEKDGMLVNAGCKDETFSAPPSITDVLRGWAYDSALSLPDETAASPGAGRIAATSSGTPAAANRTVAARNSVTGNNGGRGGKGGSAKSSATSPLTPRTPPAISALVAARDAAMEELGKLVGIESVKGHVRELCNEAIADVRRRQIGIEPEPRTRHMLFLGNAGTGKTTVATIVARLLHGLGVVPTDKFKLYDSARSALVAGVVGETPKKARKVINEAMDGVLFLDEAYTLIPMGGGTDYAQEAIDVLLAASEENRDRLVIILGGYKTEIHRLLAYNQGLASRFPNTVNFPNYTPAELFQVAERLVVGKGTLAPDAKTLLRENLLQAELPANARDVRNMIEGATKKRDTRIAAIAEPTRADLTMLTAADFSAEA